MGGGAGGAIPKATLDVVGGIKVGDDLEVCNDDKAGTMRYSAGQMEYCNGSGWMQMGGHNIVRERAIWSL